MLSTCWGRFAGSKVLEWELEELGHETYEQDAHGSALLHEYMNSTATAETYIRHLHAHRGTAGT